MLNLTWKIVITCIVFLYGIVIGSFLNVCIFRIPLKEEVVKTRSHCMLCGHILKWYELIPLFSWLIQGGKCRACKAKISRQYPLVEGLNGLLWLLVFFRYKFSYLTLIYFLMASCLIVIFVLDLRNKKVYLSTLLFLSLLGIIRVLLDYKNILYYLSGAIIVGLLLFIISKINKGRTIDMGTVLLMAICALLTGRREIIIALILGLIISLIALLIKFGIKKSDDKTFSISAYFTIGIFVASIWGADLVAGINALIH